MRVLSSTSKPISSPGRTDKFPPPLMRFLRSNVSSRSRGRTRASPLFLRRRKAITSSSSAIETTQEPSSPKVTCIGQVHVRRSKSKTCSSSSKTLSKIPRKNIRNNCCYCFPKPSFSSLKFWKPSFRKWVLFFNCRSVKVRTDSSKFGSNRFEQQQQEEKEEEEEEEQKTEEERERRNSVSLEATSTTTPPKNALLLTRCRSTPYRSSSLAFQFWGLPLKTEEEKAQKTEEERNRASGMKCGDSTSESRGDQDSEGCGRLSNIISKKDLGNCAEVENGNYLKDVQKPEDVVIVDDVVNGGFKTPLMLMRCKSEPARRDLEKIDPESSEFWRHRRLGNTQSCTPESHALDLST